MGFLIFCARQQSIIAKKSALQYKLLQMNQKLQDLLSYTSSLGDGSISYGELTQAPASVFGRMMNFSIGSAYQAKAVSDRNFAMLANVNPQFASTPGMEQLMRTQLYNQARGGMVEQEKTKLHLMEKKWEQEKVQIENQLRLIEQEEQTTAQAIQAGAKAAAPKYVA